MYEINSSINEGNEPFMLYSGTITRCLVSRVTELLNYVTIIFHGLLIFDKQLKLVNI